MTVSTIATIAAGLTRTLGNNATRSSNVFNNLLAAAPRASGNPSVNTDITAAIGLQNQIAQFRVASRDVAQAGALLSTAQSGANDINQRLARLSQLATQAAAPTATAEERAQLNTEFQAIRAQIDQTALNTRFGSESLLDGSSQQLRIANESGDQRNLSVGSLTTATLFKNTTPDISTASGAKVAQTTVNAAIDYAAAQLANIESLQSGLDLAAASLQSAIQNQEAANSSLNEVDFTSALFGLTDGRKTFGYDSVSTQFAQTRRLPPSFLSLLSE